MENRELLANYLAMLGEIHNKEVTKVLIEAFFVTLSPYADNIVEQSFKRIMAKSKFFPKPSEVIENIQKDRIKSHAEAWAEVMEGLEYGVQPSDFSTRKAIRALGGWESLQLLTYDELHWKQVRFKEFYQSFTEREEFDLIGFEEREMIEA